jgi:hypothetical protein
MVLLPKKNTNMKYVKTFEGFVNEAESPMGPKAKKFVTSKEIDNEYNWFTDADKGGDEPLPNEYHRALKTLNIKADDAIVCFFDAIGDYQATLNMATKAGLDFVEISGDEDEDDPGSGGIVFSAKK